MTPFFKPVPGSPPLWLLDVDGVINCFPAPTFDQLMASQEWNDELVDGYKIWWKRSVVDFINRMSREGLAQVVWLTTWTTSAATELAPRLGLDAFPVIENTAGDEWPTTSWWKWLRVQEVVTDPAHPFVWTDDDLTPGVRRELQALSAAHLAIAPKTSPALEPHHLLQIEAFLKRQKESL